MEIFESKYAKVEYHTQHDQLEITWEGFAPSQGFREALLQVAAWLNDQRVSKWLINHQNSKIISPEDQQWVIHDWFGYLKESSRCPDTIAVVNGMDYFGKLSVGNLSEAISKTMGQEAFQIFGSRQDAAHWLQTSMY
ncbi:MAG TPA: hypothetical protein DCE41_22870 [Cytophagales bacterium]|nr:hypothetical protein [Cytophagales bacterium]HAA22879.1 hypothetical protein [Cytophagales bacterium]HAP60544.1 hypothetical protein [Cytophagales bacterium]